MSSNLKLILIIFLISFIFPPNIKAAFTYTIDNISTSTISDKEQIVTATLNIFDLPSGDSYFRIGIDQGSSYIGYNKVGSDWVKLALLSEDEDNETCSKYLKINSDGTYTLDFKIGNDIDIANGNHVLKAHRFRSTCTIDSLKPEVAMVVLLPTPTPSPSPVPTSTPTQESTQTPTASPTKSPTPIPTPVKTASPKPTTPKPTSTESGQAEESLALEPQVLSLSTVASSAEPKTAGKNKSPILAILLVFSGVCFLGYGGYMLYNQTYENKTNTN